MITRRNVLKTMAAGSASFLLPQCLPSIAGAAASARSAEGPKRIIFYVQQHGIHEMFVNPKGGRHGDRLADPWLGICPCQPVNPADENSLRTGLGFCRGVSHD